MRPINFKETNKTLNKPNSWNEKKRGGMMVKCDPLPIHTDGINCLSCWKMSFFERLKALIFGKIWVFVWSGTTQPPISLNCRKNAFIKEKKQ